MTNVQLVEGGYLDADGWPTGIPDGQRAVSTFWAWGGTDAPDPAAAASRAGVYVLTYEGEGTIELRLGAKVLSAEPGRIVFENKTGTQMVLDITATDPKRTGDYVRDISVVPQEYEALHAAGAIFNPDWLELVADARELRFMDWMKTNASEQSDWADRPKVTDATWTGEAGVPVEVMVELANQTGTDPWFTMPAKATDAYIRNFATYVRDHLDPGLVAHVEYSNELWNWGFQQTHWAQAQAKALWGPTADTLDYVAMRATETALIWDEVFGAAAEARVENVLGTQTANTWIADRLLTAPAWKANDPSGFVDPASVFDALAVTTYFGHATVGDAALRAELIAVLKTPGADANAWLAARLMDPAYSGSIPEIVTWWANNKAVADRFGLDLVAYEGGQHVHHSLPFLGLTAADEALLLAFMNDFVRSPEMGALYATLWDAWAKVSDGAFMQYGDVGEPSKWGAWGLLSALGDLNPRAEVLFANNADGGAWFGDGGGGRYLQGVTRLAGDTAATLTGTTKDDFLIGGKGNDTLQGGAGDDGLNGGAGTDTLRLAGRPADYRLTAEANGYNLTGSDGKDFILNVETFTFDGGETRKLQEMLAQGSAPAPTPVPTPTPPPAPVPVSPQAAGTLALKGALLDANGAVAVAATVKGVLIQGVNEWSTLGKELKLNPTAAAPSYLVSEQGATAVINGTTVKADYLSLQENKASQTGTALSATSTETALKLGSIVTDATTITATAGNDIFLGRDAADKVYGAAGNDFLAGSGGNDSLYGDDGNDTLIGGKGDDLLDGGAGTNLLMVSGKAADYRLVAEGTGHRLVGTDGSDLLSNIQTIQFDGGVKLTLAEMLAQGSAPAPTPVPTPTPPPAPATPQAAGTLALKGALLDANGAVAIAATVKGVIIEGITDSSALGKALKLDPKAAALAYHVSEQGLTEEAGLQRSKAAQSVTEVSTTAAALKLGSIVTDVTAITATAGNDTFLGRKFADQVHGAAGNDFLMGRSGNDSLFGGDGNDILFAGAGADILIGGKGNDLLIGGAGRDRFVITRDDGGTRIMDFTAEDTLDLRGLGITSLAAHDSLDANGDLRITQGQDGITLVGLDQSDLGWITLMA